MEAEIPDGMVAVVKPPWELYEGGFVETGLTWVLHRVVYGLTGGPRIWGSDCDKVLRSFRWRGGGK
eukprot:12921662-Prorocentrum_lima.AAC.1